MTQPTYGQLAKALYDLHDLVGVALSLRERKVIQDAMLELFKEYLLENIGGPEWKKEKGPIKKAIESLQ